MPRAIVDLTGQRFGALVAVEPSGKRYARESIWRCCCDCGNKREARVSALKCGEVVSCGCGAVKPVPKPKKRRKALTRERLAALLIYDPATGQFIRRVTVANATAGSVAGAANKKGYIDIRIDGRSFKAHRLAFLYMTGRWPSAVVDHANRDPGDNRWANLREASNAENCANASLRRDNTVGAKGVRPIGQKWQVRIGRGGSKFSKTFPTYEEAVRGYREAAFQIYGVFGASE